jgi:hypothetical protein
MEPLRMIIEVEISELNLFLSNRYEEILSDLRSWNEYLIHIVT